MLKEESVKKIMPALKEARINFIASLPSKALAPLTDAISAAEGFIHVPVAHEGDAIGICAGASLVGKKPAIVMQNCGLILASYALLDSIYWFGGFPFLLILDHRGAFGDSGGFIFSGYGVQVPRMLDSYEIPYMVVDDVNKIPAAVLRGAKTVEASGRPAAVLLSGEAI